MPSDPATLAMMSACVVLVTVGAAVQVAVGAGLSVVCGSFVLLWLGAGTGVPLLLFLNLLLSVVATAFGTRDIRWGDAALASGATLAGCALAGLLPVLPDAVLRALTAAALVVVAVPRPPAPDRPPSPLSARSGIGLAGLVAGLLTVWTATPGPIIPVAMGRTGRSGEEIRQTAQPVGVVGYGAGLLAAGLPRPDALGQGLGSSGWSVPGGGVLTLGMVVALAASAVGGGFMGLLLRRYLSPARVVLFIRAVAGFAALLLLASLLR